MALLRYVVGWAIAGGLLVAVATMLTHGDADGEPVGLPPVTQIDLVQAARSAGCELASGDQRGDGLPTRGSAARAAEPRVYDAPVAGRALVGAMRAGIVVFHFRPAGADTVRDELRRLQATVPRGTIVTPNPAMRYTLAATAWQRSLGCPRRNRDAIDALRLFRGRYLGTGPDSP